MGNRVALLGQLRQFFDACHGMCVGPRQFAIPIESLWSSGDYADATNSPTQAPRTTSHAYVAKFSAVALSPAERYVRQSPARHQFRFLW